MAIHAGKGTVFQVSINSSYVPVGQVVTIGGPDATVGTVETTDLDATMRTFAPTIGDAGSVNFTCNYDPANQGQAYLSGLVASPSTVTCKIIFPTTTKFYQFGAVLTQFARGGVTVDNIHTIDVGLKLSSTFTSPTTA